MARALAGSLARDGNRDVTLFLDRRFLDEAEEAEEADETDKTEGTEKTIAAEPFDLPVRPVVERAFAEYPSLVLFLSAGASIRLLAPCLEGKKVDPAVVCVDDAGSFCVSLVSGHVGGADRLAQ